MRDCLIERRRRLLLWDAPTARGGSVEGGRKVSWFGRELALRGATQ